MKKLILTTALLLSMATGANAAGVTTVESSMGNVLATDKGMTLYIFTKDVDGVSVCYDGCAKAWPPYIAEYGEAVNGDFTTVKRKDATMQWAYKGQPLYSWVGDKEKGDMTGHKMKDVWFVAKQ